MTDRMEFYVPGQPFDGGTHHYVESGLENVFLKNGFFTEEHPEHGSIVHFEDVADLHRAIGLALVEEERPLRPREIRFLRRQMRDTQAVLAKGLGVDVQTLANYEKGITPISKPADRLLRLLFVINIMPPDVQSEFLKDLLRNSEGHTEKRHVSAERKKIVNLWAETDRPHACC